MSKENQWCVFLWNILQQKDFSHILHFFAKTGYVICVRLWDIVRCNKWQNYDDETLNRCWHHQLLLVKPDSNDRICPVESSQVVCHPDVCTSRGKFLDLDSGDLFIERSYCCRIGTAYCYLNCSFRLLIFLDVFWGDKHVPKYWDLFSVNFAEWTSSGSFPIHTGW